MREFLRGLFKQKINLRRRMRNIQRIDHCEYLRMVEAYRRASGGGIRRVKG